MTTMLHVRIDEEVKAKSAKALKAMGLSVSDVVRMLLTRIATEKALPFEVRVPNAKTAAALRELDAGGLKSYGSVPELMAALNAED